ncbi:MAG: hypothetical protein K0R25_40 [Rickettsiaceae bacterium]|jgi:Zn-dependent protease with chaperone function|nr:hypothetical protein [Rickettsiaceae bacterium]
MLSKPLNLLLVYVLILINFLILVLPFAVAIVPFIDLGKAQVIFEKYISLKPEIVFYWLVFAVSFFMILYLLCDFIFGFSVNSTLKDCEKYEELSGYDFLEDVIGDVRFKFGAPKVDLYIKPSEQVNAFAVGGIRKKAIVLTTGLIDHFATSTENDRQFLLALRSIVGHEMSHLMNKDYLSGLLIIANQRANNFIGKILLFSFSSMARIFGYRGEISNKMVWLIFLIYDICNWILNIFNRIVVNNIYKFLKNFLGRLAEYRCDRESAKAFGGIDMAFALSFLGKSGYLSLFSTHPSTARRIRKVEVVEEKNAIIRPFFITEISNFASIMILPVICYYSFYAGKLNVLAKFYIYYHYPEFYFQVLKLFPSIWH